MFVEGRLVSLRTNRLAFLLGLAVYLDLLSTTVAKKQKSNTLNGVSSVRISL